MSKPALPHQQQLSTILQIDVKVCSSAVSPSDAPLRLLSADVKRANRGRRTDRGTGQFMQGNWKDNGQRSLPICPNVEPYPACLHACLHVHNGTDFTNLCSVICTKTPALSQQSVFSLCTHTLTHKNCTQISPEPNYCSITQCYTELACSVGAQLKTIIVSGQKCTQTLDRHTHTQTGQLN